MAIIRKAVMDSSFLAPADAKTTFGQYAEQWFTGLAVRPSTLAAYRNIYTKHLQPAFGARRLDRISRQDVLASSLATAAMSASARLISSGRSGTRIDSRRWTASRRAVGHLQGLWRRPPRRVGGTAGGRLRGWPPLPQAHLRQAGAYRPAPRNRPAV